MSADPHSPPARPAAAARAPDSALFPYMFWAHGGGNRTDHPLSQSGMPPADPAFLAGLGREGDLEFPALHLPALEEAIAARHGVPRERVMVTLGATGGMFLAAARWFRPGTRVVADLPSYEPFRALPRFFGADLRVLERRIEDGWTVDPRDVRRLLAEGSGPGHVFLSNPHNPTGVQLDGSRMAAIAAEAARAGGLLVSCDIYMEYVPRERRSWAHACAPNAVTIGSVTKAYGLGALRIGWIVLGEGVAAEREHLVDCAYLGYVDPPSASLRSGAAAFAGMEALLRPLRAVEKESRPIWAGWLSSTAQIECVVPEHGIIAFPRVSSTPTTRVVGVDDTRALCEHLATRHGVDVVPGEFFGKAGHVRVGCGVPPSLLREGLARLERGIRSFRGLQPT